MRRKFILLSIISILLTSILTFTFNLFIKKPFKKPIIDTTDIKYQSKVLPKPIGKEGLNLSALENLFISVGVMQNQKTYQFHGEGKVIANTGIFGSFTQKIIEDAIYKNGNFVLTGISPSKIAMARVIEEHFENPSQGIFLVRKGNADGNEGTNLRWNEKPSRYSKLAYQQSYGIKNHTPSPFILNEQTVIKASQEILANGTIKITTELKADLASEFYKRTITTQSGASECVYEKIIFTTIIDKSWQTLSTKTETIYQIDKGGGTTCNTVMEHHFSYLDKEIEQLDYYKKYANISDKNPEPEKSPMQVLAEIFTDKIKDGLKLDISSDKLGQVALLNVSTSLDEATKGEFIVQGELARFGLRFKYFNNKIYLYYKDKYEVIDLANLEQALNESKFKSFIKLLTQIIRIDKITSGSNIEMVKDEYENYIISINLSIATLRIRASKDYKDIKYELITPSLAKYLGRLSVKETTNDVVLNPQNPALNLEQLIKNTIKTQFLSIDEISLKKDNLDVLIKDISINFLNLSLTATVDILVSNVKISFDFHLTKDGLYLKYNNSKLFFSFNDINKISSIIGILNSNFTLSSLTSPIVDLITLLNNSKIDNLDYQKIINKILIIIDNIPKSKGITYQIKGIGNKAGTANFNLDEYQNIAYIYDQFIGIVNRFIEATLLDNFSFNFNYHNHRFELNGVINYKPSTKDLVLNLVVKKGDTLISLDLYLSKYAFSLKYNNKLYSLSKIQVIQLVNNALDNLELSQYKEIFKNIINRNFNFTPKNIIDINNLVKEITIKNNSLLFNLEVNKQALNVALDKLLTIKSNNFSLTEGKDKLDAITSEEYLSKNNYEKLVNLVDTFTKFYKTQKLALNKFEYKLNNTNIRLTNLNISLKDNYFATDISIDNDKFSLEFSAYLVNNDIYLKYNNHIFKLDYNNLELFKKYLFPKLDINLVNNIKDTIFGKEALLDKLVALSNLIKDKELPSFNFTNFKEILNLNFTPNCSITSFDTYTFITSGLIEELLNTISLRKDQIENFLKGSEKLTFTGEITSKFNNQDITISYLLNLGYKNKTLEFGLELIINKVQIKISYTNDSIYVEYNNEVISITKDRVKLIIKSLLDNFEIASKYKELVNNLLTANFSFNKVNLNKVLQKIDVNNKELLFNINYNNNQFDLTYLDNKVKTNISFNNYNIAFTSQIGDYQEISFSSLNSIIIDEQLTNKIINFSSVLTSFIKEQKLSLAKYQFRFNDYQVNLSDINISLLDKFISFNLELASNQFSLNVKVAIDNDNIYIGYNNQTFTFNIDGISLIKQYFYKQLDIDKITKLKNILFSDEKLTSKIIHLAEQFSNIELNKFKVSELIKYLDLSISNEAQISIPNDSITLDNNILENLFTNISSLIEQGKEIIKNKEVKAKLAGSLDLGINNKTTKFEYKIFAHLKDNDILLKVELKITSSDGEVNKVKLIYDLNDFLIEYNNQVVKIKSTALEEVVVAMMEFFNQDKKTINYVKKLFSKDDFTINNLLKLQIPKLDINTLIKSITIDSNKVDLLFSKINDITDDFNLKLRFKNLGARSLIKTQKATVNFNFDITEFDDIVIDLQNIKEITDSDLSNFANLLKTFKPIYDKKALTIKNLRLDLGNSNYLYGKFSLNIVNLRAEFAGYAVINNNKFSISLVLKNNIIYLKFFQNLRTKLALSELKDLGELFSNLNFDFSNIDFTNIQSSLSDLDAFFNKGVIKKICDNLLSLFISKDVKYDLLMKVVDTINNGDVLIEAEDIDVNDQDLYQDFKTKVAFINNIFKTYNQKDLTYTLEHNYSLSGKVVGLAKDPSGVYYEKDKYTFNLKVALGYSQYNNFRIRGQLVDHTRKDQIHNFELTYNDKTFYLNYGELYAKLDEDTLKKLIVSVMSGLGIKSELLEKMLGASSEDYGDIFKNFFNPEGSSGILDLDKIVLNASVFGDNFNVEVDKSVFKDYNALYNLDASLDIKNNKIAKFSLNHLYSAKNDYLKLELEKITDNFNAILTDSEKARYQIEFKNIDILTSAFFRTAALKKYHIIGMGNNKSIKMNILAYYPNIQEVDFKIEVLPSGEYLMHLHYNISGSLTYLKTARNEVNLYIKGKQVMLYAKTWATLITPNSWYKSVKKYYANFFDDNFADNLADVLRLSDLVRNELRKNIKPNTGGSEFDKDKLPLFDALFKKYQVISDNRYNITMDLKRLLGDKQLNDLELGVNLVDLKLNNDKDIKKYIDYIDIKTRVSVINIYDAKFKLVHDQWNITFPADCEIK